MDRREDYLRRAETAERQADAADTPTDQEAYARVAAAWRQLADDAGRERSFRSWRSSDR
jgi:hypothetical protein